MSNEDIVMQKVYEDFPNLDKEWIYKIIHYGQWRAAKEALSENKSVELTGLGRFRIRDKKILRAIKEREKKIYFNNIRINDNSPDIERFKKINNTLENEIEYLKTKI